MVIFENCELIFADVSMYNNSKYHIRCTFCTIIFLRGLIRYGYRHIFEKNEKSNILMSKIECVHLQSFLVITTSKLYIQGATVTTPLFCIFNKITFWKLSKIDIYRVTQNSWGSRKFEKCKFGYFWIKIYIFKWHKEPNMLTSRAHLYWYILFQ